MRVRMRTIYAGPRGNAGPGQLIDLPAAECEKLIQGRFAERVESATNANSGEASAGTKPPAKSDGAVIDDQEPEANGVRLPDGVEADTPLEELDLSDSIVAALAEHSPSLTTVGQVVVFCEDHELTDIAGIGKSSATRIRALLGLT